MQGQFLDMDFDAVEAMFRVNIVALTHLTQLFARDMAKRGNGYVLNVASAAAFLPSPYVSAYAATKSYVLGFSEALRFELRGTGVSVTTLYPGITTTEFNEVAHVKTPPAMNLSILSAAEVARIGARAMFARRRAIVPGLINKLNAFFSAVLPRGFVSFMAGTLLARANGWK
jgi:short-subunit dehydrogenase